MLPRRHRSRAAFTILELAIALGVITALLAILLPALASARETSARAGCAANLKWWGAGWALYLADHDNRFPYVPVQSGWRYGGVRFSPVDGRPFVDTQRPLSAYLHHTIGDDAHAGGRCRCPADAGITGEAPGFGTGRRTAFRAYGTSYRANDWLLDAERAGRPGALHGLDRAEIITVPSRLVLMGDPVWYEVRAGTGRRASWHGEPNAGNLLFLDGSVRFGRIREHGGPAVFNPRLTEPEE